jgi:hypothetical protein
VKPPTPSTGPGFADWSVSGPWRAVTFIPAGIGPGGALIFKRESMSIEQAISYSFLGQRDS